MTLYSKLPQAANFGEYKAVFRTPCTEIMTLSSPVPDLTQFTLCTYIKLESSDPWTAFTYKLPSSPSNVYEIGLLGDSSSIKIWMFGTSINVLKSLNLLTWYEMCIKWSAQTENMAFFIDGTLEKEHNLKNYTKLQGGGNVVLGCSQFEELNSTISVELVGELYMFRMWRTDEVRFFQKCIDGNVIKWNIENWIYVPNVVQQDSALPCAKNQAEIPTKRHIIHKLHKRAADSDTSQIIHKLHKRDSGIATTTNLYSASIGETLLTSTDTTNVSDVLSSSIASANTYVATNENITTSGSDVLRSSVTPANTYASTNENSTTNVSDMFSSSMITVNEYFATDYKNITTAKNLTELSQV
ncbi:adhesion G-protein coupled receptor G4-like [Mantella aurantiaca]